MDASGNVETSYNGPITLTLSSGPGGTTLQGVPASIKAHSGTVTITGLSLNTAFTGNVLEAGATGFASAFTLPFNVQVATAATYHLVFLTQPAASVRLGAAVSVVVEVLDQNNNLATNFKGQVSLSLGTNPTGAGLAGVLAASFSGGKATLSPVLVSRMGNGYALQASVAGLTSIDSTLFNVLPPPLPSFAFLN